MQAMGLADISRMTSPSPSTFLRIRLPEGVDRPALRLLGIVGLALLFEEYDGAMLISALMQIAHDLGMAEKDLGLYMGLIRLGALPAFLLVPLTDRIGRRPMFLLSTVMLGVLTFATAFVQTPMQFVIAQALTRTFFVTSTAVAFVIVTEELPAQSRGWGVGMLAALGSVGHGLGAAVFSQVDNLPYGWRALYVLGIVPVLCMPLFLRFVPETARFAQHQEAQRAKHGDKTPSMFEPMRLLFTQHTMRALGLALAGFLVAAATLPSFQFSGYYTQTALGWSPGDYGLMVIAAGAVGTLGNIVAGRVGDRFGRKAVGFVLLSLFPLAAYAFFHGTGWVVVAAWVPLVFCFMGGRVILRALSTELFPTSARGAAAGVFTVMEALGAVAGMIGLHFYGTPSVEDIARVVSMISCLVIGAAVVLLFFPETRQRELEDLSIGH
jgi:MFS transporter, putative metabolite:H+ symporter